MNFIASPGWLKTIRRTLSLARRAGWNKRCEPTACGSVSIRCWLPVSANVDGAPFIGTVLHIIYADDAGSAPVALQD